MKLYPYEIPKDRHPDSWWVLGFGLSPNQVELLTRHLVDDLGLRLSTGRREVTYSWAVDLAGDWPDRQHAQVGDVVDVVVAEHGAVRITGGALPPGVTLEKRTGRLVGAFTHPGLYSVTMTIGPAVKYDPLGTPGGPGDPGRWIPIDQPRDTPATALNAYPATVDDLDDLDKDRLLAELLAWRDGQAIKEADNGN